MAALFNLEVTTPHRLFFFGPVEAISLTLADGEAGIYANHSPITAPVVPCLLKILDKDGLWKTAFCAEGILEVTSEKTVLLSDATEWPEEIDYDRAKAAKESAEKTITAGTFKFETETAALSLQRAIMRLRARGESTENR